MASKPTPRTAPAPEEHFWSLKARSGMINTLLAAALVGAIRFIWSDHETATTTARDLNAINARLDRLERQADESGRR